jgi:Family of unknown function (DUF6402)
VTGKEDQLSELTKGKGAGAEAADNDWITLVTDMKITNFTITQDWESADQQSYVRAKCTTPTVKLKRGGVTNQGTEDETWYYSGGIAGDSAGVWHARQSIGGVVTEDGNGSCPEPNLDNCRDWLSLAVKPKKGLYYVYVDPFPILVTREHSDGSTGQVWEDVRWYLPEGEGNNSQNWKPLADLQTGNVSLQYDSTHGPGPAGGRFTCQFSVELSELLPRIPNILNHFGWRRGEAILNKWFAGPPRRVGSDFNPSRPDLAPPECLDVDNIVKLGWVLAKDAAGTEKYPRAHVGYKLIKERALLSERSRESIRCVLKCNDLFKDRRKYFGGFQPDGTHRKLPAHKLDKDYYQFAPVAILEPEQTRIDDLLAAMGRFAFRAVVAGYVEPAPNLPGKYHVWIAWYGMYIRDTFDFEDEPADFWGSQPLGCWWDDPYHAELFDQGPGFCVKNEDFRKWRKIHQQGSDFLAFSNIEWGSMGRGFIIDDPMKECRNRDGTIRPCP